MKMSETPWKLKRPSPLFGEHSPEIYTELLGVEEEELGKFYEEGIA
jgi:crotonobetainyl-CoA:carnitine CoA-transferase CaiB-like acyl-CoA transferase